MPAEEATIHSLEWFDERMDGFEMRSK